MARTEIKKIGGVRVGFNYDTNSYYPIGDSQYDPNYAESIKKCEIVTLPELVGATIEAQNGLEFAAPVLAYSKLPESEPKLAYQWLEGTAPVYVETVIEGATNPTYTPDNLGKFIKVRVTAVEGATGTVTSNSKKSASNVV